MRGAGAPHCGRRRGPDGVGGRRPLEAAPRGWVLQPAPTPGHLLLFTAAFYDDVAADDGGAR